MKMLPLILALLALTACSTPNILPPASAASAGTGDAGADSSGIDSYLLYTGAGSTGVLNPVRNEDRTSSAQTAPIFQLVLTPGSIVDTDPIAAELVKRMNAEGATPEERDALLTRLEARIDKLVEQNAGRFPSLTHAGLYVINIMSNGESVQKLDAETARAAGEGLAAAVKASANATEQ